MVKLIYKNDIILSNLIYATSILSISYGLMFASKKKIEKGICLVMPISKKSKYSSAITMLFCFYPMDILFLNEDFKIIDKITLNPFRLNYIPKKPAKYVLESTKNKFKDLRLNDLVKIEF